MAGADAEIIRSPRGIPRGHRGPHTAVGALMDIRRREAINASNTLKLTRQEIIDGYHFCPDWDYLLVGPNDPEVSRCTCFPDDDIKGDNE